MFPIASVAVILALGWGSLGSLGVNDSPLRGLLVARSESSVSACPMAVPSEPFTFSSDEKAGARLVPLAPDAVGLCRYAGLDVGKGSGKLDREKEIDDPAVLRSLVRSFNELESIPEGQMTCPLDTGAAMMAIFSYGSKELRIYVGLSGCRLVGRLWPFRCVCLV